ncbi:cytochrome b/b6 domain-containing protein [Gammaproteobacteria bacterium]|nr:cytochrome b/b6 domain-containing protein [Gammaproteobacteria bacterium]
MKSTDTPIVWDRFVRLFHWSLASLFFANIWLTEDGGDIHEIVGYVALALILARIAWGFIGTDTARFANFLPTPNRVVGHIKAMRHGQHAPTRGHNPLGGAMILTLMTMIIGIGVTGFLMEEVDALSGVGWIEDLHETLADLTLILVGVHVTAVLVMSRLERRNLIRQMIRGR